MTDPYVYKGTNVLINKLNIKNEIELDKIETEYALFNIDALKTSDFQINTIFDCLKIHNILFSDVYDWAGKLITINIFKKEPILGGR